MTGPTSPGNGLRLASKLHESAHEIRLFLMNDAVELGRESCKAPTGYDQELVPMLKALIASGAA